MGHCTQTLTSMATIVLCFIIITSIPFGCFVDGDKDRMTTPSTLSGSQQTGYPQTTDDTTDQTEGPKQIHGPLRAETDCPNNHAQLNVSTVGAQELLLIFSSHGDTDDVTSMTSLTCDVHLRSRVSSVISVVLLEHRWCEGGVHVRVSDSKLLRRWDVCSVWSAPGPDFNTVSNVANVSIVLHDVTGPCDFTISVRAVSKPLDGELEIRYLSATQGYIQTPGWTHFTAEGAAPFPVGMHSWLVVSSPSDHQIMVTALDVDLEEHDGVCAYDWVELWVPWSVAANSTSPPAQKDPPNTATNLTVRVSSSQGPDLAGSSSAVTALTSLLPSGRGAATKIPGVSSSDGESVTDAMSPDHTEDSPLTSFDLRKTTSGTPKSGARRKRLWQACGLTRPDTLLLDETEMHVHFHSHVFHASRTGFRMLFSFHQSLQVPERLQGKKWNCSVPHWPHFKRHFRCNLRLECESGEDETDCPYTPCQQGEGVSLSGQCYVHVRHDVKLTWNDAQAQCRKVGAYLASLTSPREWNDVMNWLHMDTRWRSSHLHVGLASVMPGLPYMYRGMHQWEDGTIAYFSKHTVYALPTSCAGMERAGKLFLVFCYTENASSAQYLCEKDGTSSEMHTNQNSALLKRKIRIPNPVDVSVRVAHAVCPSGHWTHEFLACDVQTSCWKYDEARQSSARRIVTSPCQSPLSTLFTCMSNTGHVPYSLVCDHSEDCLDASDEDFCVHPPCSGSRQFECTSKQCVPASSECDTLQDCRDHSDEELCNRIDRHPSNKDVISGYPPAVINFDGRGAFFSQPLLNFSQCPDTHFLCPGHSYCQPVFVRCNGVSDCPRHEDEEDCGQYSCPNLYRCRGSKVCLHVTHVCDGWSQCPQLDDELFCNLTCPEACTCHAHSFLCPHSFPVFQYPQIRYLDASGSGMQLDDFGANPMLIYLELARCELTHLGNTPLFNLRTLDVSFNRVRSVTPGQLGYFPKVTSFSLAGNPIVSLFLPGDQSIASTFPAMLTLDLSLVEMTRFDPSILRIFPNLQSLNLSHCNMQRVLGQGFQPLTSLQVLDVRECPMISIPKSLFQGLSSLQHVLADNYKVCCPATLPAGFDVDQCQAPVDEISSCNALLRSNLYRFSLAVFATLATVGNALSFVLRVFVLKTKQKSGYAVFVTHLCVADFLMGVYLVMIGGADRMYLGTYLWKDRDWKRGVACKVTGFMSLLSSEVSASIICLVTLDRFLVLRFPFSRLRFERRSAQVGCVLLWTMGTVLAAVPLLPATAHWDFYSQTGICIPLPVTRQDFPGHHYAFAVMIIFNFALFMLIAAGQGVIYVVVRSQSMAERDGGDKRSKDLAVARRLFTVVVSDFLCWFPIGLLGLLASRDTPIPSEVNVAMAIFVLPLNSALNPFLYSLNTIRDRRARAREQKLLKMIVTDRGNIK